MKYIGFRAGPDITKAIARIKRKALRSRRKVVLTDADVIRGSLMYGLPKLEKVWQ